MKVRTLLLSPALALLLLAACALAWAPSARADDPGAPPQGLQAQVKKKLEKVLKLMAENEAALLKLSTGRAAVPQKVAVEPPPDGASLGGHAATGALAGASGKEIRRQLEEMIKTQRNAGGTIPDELKQVVEMIPL